MSGVFLSYRRLEHGWADRLARSLANRFGGDLVFQDVEDIAGGQRWRDTIREAIGAAEVAAVAIGPHWLIDDEGRRRLNDPEDVVRAELIEAFELAKPVVPVLVGGATMPARSELPDDVYDLSELQAVRLDDMTWNIDAERLLERVRELIRPTRGSEPMDRVGQGLDGFSGISSRDSTAGALPAHWTWRSGRWRR